MIFFTNAYGFKGKKVFVADFAGCSGIKKLYDFQVFL